MTPIEIGKAAYEKGYRAGMEAARAAIDLPSLEDDLGDIERAIAKLCKELEIVGDDYAAESIPDFVGQLKDILARAADAAEIVGSA